MDGTVLPFKLAWVDNADNAILNSKMFNTIQDAVAFSKTLKTEFFIFKIKDSVDMSSGDYSWDLLPYGSYYIYSTGLAVKHFVSHPLTISIFIALVIGFGFISIKKLNVKLNVMR